MPRVSCWSVKPRDNKEKAKLFTAIQRQLIFDYVKRMVRTSDLGIMSLIFEQFAQLTTRVNTWRTVQKKSH